MHPRHTVRRLAAAAAILTLALWTTPSAPHGGGGVGLQVERGPGAEEVTLEWTGGQPEFEVFRSDRPDDVLEPFNSLGTTAGRSWTDLPPVGTIWYYQVESPCVVDPPEVCDGVDNDCDGFIDEAGAEESCSLPNATAACVGGGCVVDQCLSGYSNCDGSSANGCEVSHAAHANSCAGATFLGTRCGDANCGFLCPPSNWSRLSTQTGRTSKWFRARASECSNCCAPIRARVTLTPPAGTDYDLYVYSACGTLWTSSTNPGGAVDQVVVERADDCGPVDNGFDYWIEVRYFSGASCSTWQLEVDGASC